MKKNMSVKIQELMDEQVRQDIFPGANLAVCFQGKTSLFSCGNKAIVPCIESNDMDTMYDLASLSKVIATTNLTMQLIDEGRLSLDQKIASILPQFIHKNITIHDLLVHRSGLPADMPLTLEDTKASIYEKCMHCFLKYPTKSDVLYSDIGFIILGFLLEEVLSTTLDKACNERLFQPLDMNNTMYHPNASRNLQCAPTEDSPHFHKLIRGEVHDRKAHLMGGVSGHAGLFSTISDMSHMVEMLLGRGMYKGQRIVSQEAIQNFYTCHSPEQAIRRGIGYLIKDERSPFSTLNSDHAMLHTGFSGTSILVDFDLEIGIVLLSNRIHPTRENTKIIDARQNIHHQVLQILLEK